MPEIEVRFHCFRLIFPVNPILKEDVVGFSAICKTKASQVEVSDNCYVGNLEFFHEQLKKLLSNEPESIAELKSFKRLRLTVSGKKTGHIDMAIFMKPDPTVEKHEFHFSLDQSYFQSTVRELQRAIEHCLKNRGAFLEEVSLSERIINQIELFEEDS